MCDYCGCQDVPAIAALTSEHDQIREVAREASAAARAGDHRGAVVAAGRLLAALEPHTRIEEQGLFPAMAHEFGEHVGALTDQHRQLESALRALAAESAPLSGWQDRLTVALAELFEHILREQDGLFPASLSVLTARQWDTLDEVRARVSGGPAALPKPA